MLIRFLHEGRPRWGVQQDDGVELLDRGLHELLSASVAEARQLCRSASTASAPGSDLSLLAPVDRQEVWAAGVTYQRSREGRAEESGHALLYTHVYAAERPELFFKATPERVVAHGDAVGIRADSGWDVPEPELGLVINAGGEIFGYTVGNDMSSRSIEGDNPLYLPQAKIYDRSCALGPGIVPVWDAPEPPFGITMDIRRNGASVFSGETSTAKLARDLPGLAGWLTRAMTFPHGAVLLTGTGIVPGADFTLREGDEITITVHGVGTLTNPVCVVGSEK